jgi:hypothetical protein
MYTTTSPGDFYKHSSSMSRDSPVGIATDYGLEDRMLGVRFPAGVGSFLFDTMSRPALEPTQSSFQCVPGAVSLGIKRPGRGTDRLPPSSAEVKERVDLYLHSPNTFSWRGA